MFVLDYEIVKMFQWYLVSSDLSEIDNFDVQEFVVVEVWLSICGMNLIFMVVMKVQIVKLE